jgi:ubiquinone/menaquinone biosynthesis C-methylase UbiE
MSFDRLAPYYGWMESICAGEAMQRCRTRFLDEIPSAHDILLLGEGHGRGLVECARRFPQAQITCVDASTRMLAQAQRQLARCSSANRRVQFIHADVLNWEPSSRTYDLIVTNFFLDCFRADQLQVIVPKIAAATVPNADWLISDFQVAPAGWKRIRSRVILWSMYVFFRTMTHLPATRLTAPDPFLEQAGFRLHRRVESEWNMLHSDWWKRRSN